MDRLGSGGQEAFPDYVNALRTETEAFVGTVALVHGDSHYFLRRASSRSSSRLRIGLSPIWRM
jgi:hypothetical protein